MGINVTDYAQRQQTDNNNCGPYTIDNLRQFVAGLPIKQTDLNVLRKEHFDILQPYQGQPDYSRHLTVVIPNNTLDFVPNVDYTQDPDVIALSISAGLPPGQIIDIDLPYMHFNEYKTIIDIEKKGETATIDEIVNLLEIKINRNITHKYALLFKIFNIGKNS